MTDKYNMDECVYMTAPYSKAAHRKQQVYPTAALGRLRAECTALRLRARAAARRQEMEPGRRLTLVAVPRAAVAVINRHGDRGAGTDDSRGNHDRNRCCLRVPGQFRGK